MYESMKRRVEEVMERGGVGQEYNMDALNSNFTKWTDGVTRHHHPTVIQVFPFIYNYISRPPY